MTSYGANTSGYKYITCNIEQIYSNVLHFTELLRVNRLLLDDTAKERKSEIKGQ